MASVRGYRYRTAVMYGRCVPTREKALEEAVRTGVALRDPNPPGGVRWRFRGEIERCTDEERVSH